MNHRLELIFFYSIFIGVLVLSFYIFKPFLYALILAAIFSIVFQPIYRKFLQFVRGNEIIASLLTLVLVFVTVLIPTVLIGAQIFQEAEGLYGYVTGNGLGADSILLRVENFLNVWIGESLGLETGPVRIAADLDQYLESFISWLFQNVGSLVSGLANITLNLFIFLFAFYYLLKDGNRFKRAVISLSPLPDKYDEEISTKLENGISSVLKGSVVVGLIQGFMTGLGFYIFGIANPAFWGAVAAFSALIPGIGTSLVLGPAVLFLFFTGNIFQGAGLLVWGLTAVGLIDNFLGPKFVQRGLKIHSFLILLFALGGISFFGPIGFLLGPIVLSLLFALVDIYTLLTKEHAKA